MKLQAGQRQRSGRALWSRSHESAPGSGSCTPVDVRMGTASGLGATVCSKLLSPSRDTTRRGIRADAQLCAMTSHGSTNCFWVVLWGSQNLLNKSGLLHPAPCGTSSSGTPLKQRGMDTNKYRLSCLLACRTLSTERFTTRWPPSLQSSSWKTCRQ